MFEFVTPQSNFQQLRSSSQQWALFALCSVVCLLMAGCSQSVDEVEIKGRHPVVMSPPRNILINRDLTGTSSIVPRSPSIILGDHSTGGNALRTSSSSPSFRMQSGVGIE